MKRSGRIGMWSLGFALAALAVLLPWAESVLAEDKPAVGEEKAGSADQSRQSDQSKQSQTARQSDSATARAGSASEPGSAAAKPETAGEKNLKNEGAASEQKAESAAGELREPTNQPAPQPSGRTRLAEMKLSGSMCMSCLHEVERKLKVIPGVSKAKIEYPGERIYDYYQSPGLNSWARLTLSYDPAMLDLESLKSFLRTQGYHPFKIVEKEK
jgi:copper chaperone CopZ